jgi:hypothetical protein
MERERRSSAPFRDSLSDWPFVAADAMQSAHGGQALCALLGRVGDKKKPRQRRGQFDREETSGESHRSSEREVIMTSESKNKVIFFAWLRSEIS